MTDYADLLLSGTPEKEEQTDYADILLSGGKIEPPVGGTYNPRKFSRNAPSGTSAITGKQEMEYYPGNEPEASFGAQMKATYADTPWGKIKALAASRGIPTEEVPSRYRVGKGGEIEFKDKQGNWNREIGEARESKLKGLAAQVAGHPSTYLGTAGAAVGGVPGAVGGAMIGEVIRKGVGKTVFGEKIEPWNDLTDVAMEGVFALGGEMAGKLVSSVFNRFLSRRAGVVAKAGIGAKEAVLTTEDHGKALLLKALAQKHGIELGPHQLYDKQSILNTWKYLRNHPLTSDPIKAFEDAQQGATEESIQKFIRDMGGYKETPTALGEKLEKTATGIIDKAEATRTKRVRPKYEKAAVQAEEAGGVELKPALERLNSIIDSYPEGPSKQSLSKIKKSLMVEEKGGTTEPMTLKRGAGETTGKIPVKPEGGIEEVNWNARKLKDYEEGRIGRIDTTDEYRLSSLPKDSEELAVYKKANPQLRTDPKTVTIYRATEGKGIQTGDWVYLREDLARKHLEARSGAKIISQKVSIEDIITATDDVEFVYSPRKGKITPPAKEAGGVVSELVTSHKPTYIPERDLRKIQKAIFDLNDLIEGTSQEAAQIAPSSKKVLNRDLEILKKELLASIEKVSPEFAKANKLYEKMSPPIDRLKSSVIGELTRMKSDKTIAGAVGKVLDVSNMPDPELLRRAKTVIQKKDPELWKEMVGSYVRDVFESLRVTEEGNVVNAAGKLYKRLYGGKQGEIMKEAIKGLPQEQTFKELMEIYQKAAVGYSRESMTAQFQQIEKGLEGQLGTTAYQLAKAPKDTVVEWTLGKWNDMWMSGRQKKLLDALTSTEVIDKLKKLKQLPPGSKKFIESFSVFTAFVSDRYIEGTP
jgi:hypothetical protein